MYVNSNLKRELEKVIKIDIKTAVLLSGIVLAMGAAAGPSLGASHREAPLIALDPAADNTDVYAFVGYDADNIARPAEERRLTLIMNVNPGQEPGDGPNYFNFDDNVLYRFHVDNNVDGEAEDIVYEIRFKTETRAARHHDDQQRGRCAQGDHGP